MTIIQVVENDRLPIERNGGSRALTPRQAEVLEKLLREKRLSHAVEREFQAMRFSSYCGVIGLGNDTIEILPKIHGSGNNPQAGREVLLPMLSVAWRMKISPVNIASMNKPQCSLLDIFILNFCEKLLVQLHKGVLLRYVLHEDTLPVLRGRLLLDRQLKLNSGRWDRLYCAFDELTEDNEYNQYIKCALNIAHRQAHSLRAKRATTELLCRFDSVTSRRPEECRSWSLPERRNTKRFNEVLRQSRWFLRGLGPDVTAGARRSFSILFDMNRLFEEFITAKLRQETRGRGFQVRAQTPQHHLVQEEGGSERFQLKPDITFNSDDRVFAILDTKWKILGGQRSKYGISQADLYQMIAYGTRYQCNKLTLIYPWQDGIPQKVVLHVQATDLTITVRCVSLQKLVKSNHLDAQLHEVVREAECLAALPAAA